MGFRILFLLTVTVLLLSSGNTVLGQTLTQETSLQNAITSGYLKSLRPGSDRTQPVQVNVSFCLRSIKEFEETTGKFSITGDFELSWTDERLAWTPGSYGNIEATTFPQSMVWIPDLICTNPYNTLRGLSLDQVVVRYDYTGQATWNPGNLFEGTCDADVTFYPYDRQTCTLSFMAWGYTASDVYLSPTTDVSALNYYTESGLWVLKKTRIYTEMKGPDYQTINLEYTLKRRSTFHLINLLLPMCVMVMLHITVFLLPADSGERVGFSVTVLLALAVYMSIVADRLPESSEPGVSVLSYKLLFDILLGTGMMVMTIVGLRFYHVDESEEISKFWKSFTKFFLNFPCKRRKPSVSDVTEVQDLKTGNEYKGKEKESENEDITWLMVAKAFDNFCLIFSMMLNMILNSLLLIVFFGIAP